MNGAEHYAEAERLLAIATEVGRAITSTREDPLSPEEVRARRDDLGKQATGLFARAQVHATLALAATQAPQRDTQPEPHSTAWCNARDLWDSVEPGPRFDELDEDIQRALAARYRDRHG